MNKFIIAVYKFITAPRLRYSLMFEGLRRLFFTYTSREIAMRRIMQWAFFRKLNGDYMEFGVFQGDSFTKAFHFSKFAKLPSMKFFAFDSFSGYPPLEGVDKECGYFEEKAYLCSLDDFKSNLSKNGVNMGRVRIVSGTFNELNKNAKGKIESKVASVVWIDCDLYKATLDALDFLVDYIADGTVIVFADWFACNGSPDLGQPLAAREWLSKNPTIKLIEFFNFGEKAYIVSIPKNKKNDF